MAPTISGAALDHVAVAVERWPDAWPRYAEDLGGTWSSGGLDVGFGPAQLRFANGARLEVLQPWQTDDNPFLRRFLDRHGPGPHHLTFKVPDLAGALEQARRAGFSPIGVRLENPEWREAFLHPRQATGIVVQLAQAEHDWTSPPPEGFPAPHSGPASFVRATHAVADLGAALALFETLLGGSLVSRGDAPGGQWSYAELSWAGPPRLRLVAAHGHSPALAAWLGGLPGRLHHLVFDLPADDGAAPARGAAPPADLPGLLPWDRATGVVEPLDNLGTRLLLTAAVDSLGGTTAA